MFITVNDFIMTLYVETQSYDYKSYDYGKLVISLPGKQSKETLPVYQFLRLVKN